MGKTRTPRRACAGKRRHRDQAAATKHLHRLIRRGAHEHALVAYPCACGAWHVGHREHRKREAHG